jgi:type I restriction enzyme R subunit
MKIHESDLENAALGWFADLGYDGVFGPDLAFDGSSPERDDYRQVVLRDRLVAAVRRLNPALPASAVDDAVRQVLNLNVPGLVQSNRHFQRWLYAGVKVQYQRSNQTVGDFAKLIDFDNVDANDWLVVNQYTIQGRKRPRTPDIVVFVNGIPVVVIELKNPGDENTDIWAAFNQLETYKDEIADLFQYNGCLVISDGITARMGSLTADRERYATWRTIDGKTLDPLGERRELETLIRGAFKKDFLLDLIRSFVVFEEDGALIKKLAAYHQFHAVREAFAQTLRATKEAGDRRVGVVWHTQGSGKSISMACYAGKVMRAPEMHNPTLVVVTDRNDLDGQLYGTFVAAKELLGEAPDQADNRKDLRRLLANRPSGGIIFTTIQKFQPGEDEDTLPILSDRKNIVVIADEAHRSQYGFTARLATKEKDAGKGVRYGYAQYLRDALPNASFVGFTGTPVSQDDRDTRAVFGDYISVYDIEQAVQDGATVPIYYESRLAKLNLKPEETPNLDEEVEELTEDEEEQTQAKLKSRWAALEQLVGAQPRLEQVAADFVDHFEARLEVIDGKAMFVCMSREICARMYAEIIKLRPGWHDPDPEKGAIKVVMTGSASDKALLQPHIYSKQVKKRLEKRFKDPADPFKVVIVRDMWLTGFDAPCLHTMYDDKPMRAHNLMQAIARVNRVFKDKPGGLIVDYIGIAAELKAALKMYTASKGRGTPTIDAGEALAVLQEKVEIARGILHGFDYSAFRTQAFLLLPGATNHVLRDNAKHKEAFADAVVAMSKAFALCCTLDEAKRFRDEIAFFQAIKAAITKSTTTDKKLTDEAREHAIRQIMSKAIAAEGMMDIFAAAGLKRPDIGILSEEFLEEVRHMKERNLAVELLERLLRDEIGAKFRTNVVQNHKFSDLLQQAIRKYQNRAIETAQVIEELITMAKEFNDAALRGEKLGMNEDELAFYDALETNEASVRELGEPELKSIARELTESLRKNVSIDWSVRESVRARLRLLVRRVLRNHKYPVDREQRAIDLVLKQAESLSEVWEPA